MADVTGTNGNDFLIFQGTEEHLTTTLVNPYSGASIDIDDEYYLNTSSYEGFAGIDILFMTNLGDALFVTNDVGDQMISSVERIIAGQGGDVIILADDTIELGNMTINGGGSDDIIWGNVGDDTIRGFDGDDIIDGGPGNDTLQGQKGDDVLTGGDGDDIISGNEGADILSGDNGDDTLLFNADIIYNGGVLAYNIGSPGVDGTHEYKVLRDTNGSFDIFDGGDGYDTVVMTDGDDAIFLFDDYHDQNENGTGLRLIDVEQIDAGDGDDVVDLTHTDYSYGDIVVNGGNGNDTLWTSVGNDTIDGGNGDDSLYGGVGNDTLYGGDGDDLIIGGPNSDSGALEITVEEHTFNNTVLFPSLTERVDIMDLVPSGENALGIAAGDLSVNYSTTAEISFVQTVAGFDNTLGFYNIAQDGTIMSVELAFPNVKDFNAGDTATIDLPGAPDTDFGFFIIANGAHKNNDFSKYDLENEKPDLSHHHTRW